MDVRDVAGKDAVDLLREGGVLVSGPEARFDVADADLLVEAGQGGRERRRSVPVDEDEIGLFFFQYGFKAFEDGRGYHCYGLAGLHYVQIVVGRKLEEL